MKKTYRLKKDILIAAGTEFTVGPRKREYADLPWECAVGLHKDHCAAFTLAADSIEELTEYFELVVKQ